MLTSNIFSAFAVFGLVGQSIASSKPLPETKASLSTGPLTSGFPSSINLLSATIKDLNKYMKDGKVTSQQLVKEYLARIGRDNRKGLELRGVIETAPLDNVLKIARGLDTERKKGKTRGPLHGIPILVKDNIATCPSLGMNTTAGSYALLPENAGAVKADSTVIAQLRKAGVIIIGKTSMSEWAAKRGDVKNGWSARGGYPQSPYVLGWPTVREADPSGSSTGSAIGVAAGWAAAALGTETDGSIIMPSSVHALYSMKPSVGITSRGGVVPFGYTQDSVGPMCKSAWDAAVLMNAMKIEKVDSRDTATKEAIGSASKVQDYTKYMTDSFKGVKLALMMKEASMNYTLWEMMGITKMGFVDPTIPEVAMETMKKIESLGAQITYDNVIVPSAFAIIAEYPLSNETIMLDHEFKHYIDIYLKDLQAPVPKNPKPMRKLKDLIDFNNAHKDIEMPPDNCCQPGFIASEEAGPNPLQSESYKKAFYWSNTIHGRKEGLDAVFNQYPDIDALILPTDPIASRLPAMAGYPIVTVPMGVGKAGNPFGLSFIGRRFEEDRLFKVMSAYEANFPKRAMPKNVR